MKISERRECVGTKIMSAVAVMLLTSIALLATTDKLAMGQEKIRVSKRVSVRALNTPDTVLLAALAETKRVSFSKTPFGEVLTELSKPIESNIRIHESAAARGLTKETLVSQKLNSLSIAGVVQTIVAKHSCTLTIRNGVVMIVDVEKAPEYREVRLYDCRKLLAEEAGGDASRLVDSILRKVNPESWVEREGEGSLYVFEGVLFVSQTFVNHVLIERYLRELDQ